MAELPFNPQLQAAAGPSRDPNMPPEMLALLSLLAQSGAGPMADALGQAGSNNQELVRQLIFRLKGGFPSQRDLGGALSGLRQREAAPGPNLQPKNLGQDQELLEALLNG